jgi:ubiquinone/menaquinone biosynthesis C-methylase UbiE
MRLLESAPSRYDWGMRLITFGGVTRVHEAIADAAVDTPGTEVLEIGCGTGSVTERLVKKGAYILALDLSPDMLDIAKKRIGETPNQRIEWQETTASEIDALPENAFDSVVISLCLSDMEQHERAFVLRESLQRLREGGKIVVGDEVAPRKLLYRMFATLLRLPQLLIAWALTGFWSTPIAHLTDELEDGGFEVESEKRWRMESLAVVDGRKPG